MSREQTVQEVPGRSSARVLSMSHFQELVYPSSCTYLSSHIVCGTGRDTTQSAVAEPGNRIVEMCDGDRGKRLLLRVRVSTIP